MLNLRRDQAPISEAAWAEIDEEAKRVLELNLAARRLVDFTGPLGWEAAAVGEGGLDEVGSLGGVETHVRTSRPLLEIRERFTLSRRDLESVDRGAKAPDLGPVVAAAKRIARAEDHAVFEGFAAGHIEGIGSHSTHPSATIQDDFAKYPFLVAQVTNTLREAGVAGPYAIALGPRCYAGLIQAPNNGGYPVIDRLRNVLDGPIIWAPAIDGAVVISQRGGDFELVVGQDFSIGYSHHTEDVVHFYIVETFTFRNHAPEAGVALRYPS